MNQRITSSSTCVASCVMITLLLLFAFCELGFCRVEKNIMFMGGIRETPQNNNLELENLARFAVDEHNKKEENSLLKFGRLVKTRNQVVAGTMYYFTLEANDAGKTKLYDAKVWVKPWMNFKQLEEFKVSDEQND